MITHFHGFRASKAGFLLAVLVLGAAPAASQAGWLGFRNDTKAAIIVRTGVPVGVGRAAKVTWGRPKAMQAEEVAWDVVLQPGVRVIQVFDPNQPAQPIFQISLPVKGDQFYSIKLDAAGAVKLESIKAPMPPPGRGRQAPSK
jgi:hypothetical protein